MKLVDVSILIYAHRAENPGHEFYRQWLMDLLGGVQTFLYCDWVLAAFVRIVTHPRIYRTPTPLEMALRFVDEVRACANGWRSCQARVTGGSSRAYAAGRGFRGTSSRTHTSRL